jgi:hypothetical protein
MVMDMERVDTEDMDMTIAGQKIVKALTGLLMDH